MSFRLRGRALSMLVPIVALALRLASTSSANVSYLLMAAYALTGRAQAIQALALSWLFSMLSSGIAPEASLASVGRYAVLAGAAFSVILRMGPGLSSVAIPVNRAVLLTVLLGCLIALHALFVSPMPDVSILKAISWTVAAATLFSAWSGLREDARNRLEKQLFGGLVLLMMLSLPLVVTPLGYLRNGSGFQGVLAHPQAFGPTMGLLAAWAGSRVLSERKPQWRLVAIFGVCLILIVASGARTAGLATLLGIAIAGMTGIILSQRRLMVFLPGLRSPRLHFVLGIAMLSAIAGSNLLSERIDRYLTKRGENSSLLEAYDQSRGALIDRMWENIAAHPFRGVGFGVASDPMTMDVTRDPVLGLPTGAAIEKGVLPLAVLEELGAFGLLLVAAWIAVLARQAARGGGMTAVSVCFAALLMNMGESMLFSAGGMGLLMLIVITWATTAPRRSRETRHA